MRVTVSQAWVTLEGVVPTYRMLKAAGQDSFAVSGVRSVKNNLEVRTGNPDALPNDEEIEASIESMLLLTDDFDMDSVSVSCRQSPFKVELFY